MSLTSRVFVGSELARRGASTGSFIAFAGLIGLRLTEPLSLCGWCALVTLAIGLVITVRSLLAGVLVTHKTIYGAMDGRYVVRIPFGEIQRFDIRSERLSGRNGYPGKTARGALALVVCAVRHDGVVLPIWPLSFVSDPEINAGDLAPTASAINAANRLSRLLPNPQLPTAAEGQRLVWSPQLAAPRERRSKPTRRLFFAPPLAKPGLILAGVVAVIGLVATQLTEFGTGSGWGALALFGIGLVFMVRALLTGVLVTNSTIHGALSGRRVTPIQLAKVRSFEVRHHWLSREAGYPGRASRGEPAFVVFAVGHDGALSPLWPLSSVTGPASGSEIYADEQSYAASAVQRLERLLPATPTTPGAPAASSPQSAELVEELVERYSELRPLLDRHLAAHHELAPPVFLAELVVWCVTALLSAKENRYVVADVCRALESASENGSFAVQLVVAEGFFARLPPYGAPGSELRAFVKPATLARGLTRPSLA